ncbi:hypothetical protein D6D27_03553 [Aureobasidium pullulans]|nr:hypothetical protein D6D27_03553 [Aureobasidium pullulans]
MDQSSPTTRPRTTSRAFSHKSDHSRSSKHEVLVDNPAEKQRRDSFWKGGSKANPNAAMNEAQPGGAFSFLSIFVFPVTPANPNKDAAVMEKATMESLRNVQHKDSNGNVITEPDLSNPTRPRWERPLDTIRSFERAIDGGYKRRSVSRSESYTYTNHDQSRRSSYYGGNNYDSGRYENGSQYAGGHYASRRPDGHSDIGVGPGAPPSRNRYAQRMNASRSNSAYGFYPQHSYNDSYDTGAANHSDSTGPWNNSTDPSSENSSLDRANGVPKQTDPYGYDIYNGPPIMEEYASDSDGGYGMSHGNRNGHAGGNPSAPTQSQAPPVRAPIKLGGAEGASNFSSQGGHLPPATRPTPVKEEKKKGFFKKRFSKG